MVGRFGEAALWAVIFALGGAIVAVVINKVAALAQLDQSTILVAVIGAVIGAALGGSIVFDRKRNR